MVRLALTMVSHRLSHAAGLVAIGVSLLLLVVVLVRDVGLNPVNEWTILLGGAAGARAMRAGRRWRVAVALALLVAAALPASPGGMGLLYAPSVGLLTGALVTYPRPEVREVWPTRP